MQPPRAGACKTLAGSYPNPRIPHSASAFGCADVSLVRMMAQKRCAGDEFASYSGPSPPAMARAKPEQPEFWPGASRGAVPAPEAEFPCCVDALHGSSRLDRRGPA